MARGHKDVRFVDAVKERPEALKKAGERAAIGGLSRAAHSAARVLGLLDAGAKLAEELDRFYDNNTHIQNKILMACAERLDGAPLD